MQLWIRMESWPAASCAAHSSVTQRNARMCGAHWEERTHRAMACLTTARTDVSFRNQSAVGKGDIPAAFMPALSPPEVRTATFVWRFWVCTCHLTFGGLGAADSGERLLLVGPPRWEDWAVGSGGVWRPLRAAAKPSVMAGPEPGEGGVQDSIVGVVVEDEWVDENANGWSWGGKRCG